MLAPLSKSALKVMRNVISSSKVAIESLLCGIREVLEAVKRASQGDEATVNSSCVVIFADEIDADTLYYRYMFDRVWL